MTPASYSQSAFWNFRKSNIFDYKKVKIAHQILWTKTSSRTDSTLQIRARTRVCRTEHEPNRDFRFFTDSQLEVENRVTQGFREPNMNELNRTCSVLKFPKEYCKFLNIYFKFLKFCETLLIFL
jgi:hypothetical protein